MPDDSKLTDLQNAWKKMEESEKAASNKATLKEGANDPTPTSKKFSVADTHSKAVKPVDRNPGSEAGAKEVGDEHGAKAPAGESKPVKRAEGAAAGAKEVGEDHGSKAPVEGAKPVPRKEGSAAAPQKYGEFRNKIKAVLGLSLDDPLNKVGQGLNKG